MDHMDQKRFEEAKRKIIGVDRQRLGIGTLSEKTVHAIFKDYYEPDEDHQEIPIENYVADIYKDGEIIEIQGTGEGRAFTVAEQQELVALCAKGNRELIAKQKEVLGDILR